MALDLFKCYAIVLLLVLPFWVAVAGYIHTNRFSQSVQKRSYFSLQFQNIGGIISILLIVVSLFESPYNTCSLFLWATFAIYPLVLLPAAKRAWVFCFRYHLNQEAKFKRTDEKPKWMTKLHVASSPWLFKFFWVLLFAQIIVPLGIMSYTYATHKPQREIANTRVCVVERPELFLPVFVTLSAFYAIGTVWAAIYLREARDAYNIKKELTFYAVSISIMTAVIIVQQIVGFKMLQYLPLRLTMGVEIVGIFFASGVRTAYLCQKEKRVDTVLSEADLVVNLASPIFRERFADFLSYQLSLENLLFWEEVQKFKTLHDQVELEHAGKAIVEKYIRVGGIRQLNVSSSSQKAIMFATASNNFTPTCFDEAQNEILSLMKFNSYPQFILQQQASVSTHSQRSLALESIV
jgi:hypothetical protein